MKVRSFCYWRVQRALTRTLRVLTILTECQAIGASRLKYVRDDSHDAEDETGQDQFHDVVERFATKMKGNDNANVRRLTAVVPVLCHSHWNVCATGKHIARTKLLRTYHVIVVIIIILSSYIVISSSL